MFIKNGDDPNSKIVSIIDTNTTEDLDEDVKLALDKVKAKVVIDAAANKETIKDLEKN